MEDGKVTQQFEPLIDWLIELSDYRNILPFSCRLRQFALELGGYRSPSSRRKCVPPTLLVSGQVWRWMRWRFTRTNVNISHAAATRQCSHTGRIPPRFHGTVVLSHGSDQLTELQFSFSQATAVGSAHGISAKVTGRSVRILLFPFMLDWLIDWADVYKLSFRWLIDWLIDWLICDCRFACRGNLGGGLITVEDFALKVRRSWSSILMKHSFAMFDAAGDLVAVTTLTDEAHVSTNSTEGFHPRMLAIAQYVGNLMLRLPRCLPEPLEEGRSLIFSKKSELNKLDLLQLIVWLSDFSKQHSPIVHFFFLQEWCSRKTWSPQLFVWVRRRIFTLYTWWSRRYIALRGRINSKCRSRGTPVHWPKYFFLAENFSFTRHFSSKKPFLVVVFSSNLPNFSDANEYCPTRRTTTSHRTVNAHSKTSRRAPSWLWISNAINRAQNAEPNWFLLYFWFLCSFVIPRAAKRQNFWNFFKKKFFRIFFLKNWHFFFFL